MTRCITISAGRRPITSRVMLEALWLQTSESWDDVYVAAWAQPLGINELRHRPKVVDVPGAARGACHNAALEAWKADHAGQLPDFWHILDDDVVPSQLWFQRQEAVWREAEATPFPIALLGGWNEGAERGRGWTADVQTEYGVEVVQYGEDFNIGGAVMCLPRVSIEAFGGYDGSVEQAGTEDHELTTRIRQAGKLPAITRTVHSSILRDDGWDPNYRAFKQHQRDVSLHHLGLGPKPS